MRGRLALARISDSFPFVVLIDMAALHEIASGGAHRANDDLLALEGGSRVWIEPFYENLER